MELPHRDLIPPDILRLDWNEIRYLCGCVTRGDSVSAGKLHHVNRYRLDWTQRSAPLQRGFLGEKDLPKWITAALAPLYAA